MNSLYTTSKFAIIILALFFISASASCKHNKNSSQINTLKKDFSSDKNLFIATWTNKIKNDDYQGFILYKDGSANSVNRANLLYKKWKVVDNKLILKYLKFKEDFSSSAGNEIFIIKKITSDSLILESEKKTFKYIRNEAARFPSVNIKANQTVKSPLMIKVNSKGVWTAYEGELGTVSIVDETGRELGKTQILTSADGDWMHIGNALFQAKLTFKTNGKTKAKLVFYNDSGPGEGEEAGKSEKFEIPVKLK